MMPAWLLNLKIADRLTFWFLAISIVPCSVLALVTYRLSENSIEDTVHRTLLVTAEQKAAQIKAPRMKTRPVSGQYPRSECRG